jgi:hypothetical protein
MFYSLFDANMLHAQDSLLLIAIKKNGNPKMKGNQDSTKRDEEKRNGYKWVCSDSF